MKRVGASLVLLCGLIPAARADEPMPPSSLANPSGASDAAKDGIYLALLAKAERERRGGRIEEAALAYAEAFKLREDPLIGGRLGVLLVELEQPTKAADILLEAIEHATDASPAERHAFLLAYDKAVNLVCRVDIDISEAHTTVAIDGVDKFKDAITGFTLFMTPGEHELRAKLDGFDDAVSHITAWKGGTLRVKLQLLPRPKPTAMEAIAPPERLFLRRQARARSLEASRDAELPPDDEPEKEPIYGGVEGAERVEKPRVSVGVGPVVVFGVASWQPAVGAVAEVRYRPREYLSLGIEGRAAWLTSGVGGEPISAMTAGGLASICGHWRWLYGCGLGYVGTVNIEFTNRSYNEKSYALTQPGGGARLGVLTRFGSSFVLQINADALLLSRGMTIIAGQTTLVQQGPFMFDMQVLGGWEF